MSLFEKYYPHYREEIQKLPFLNSCTNSETKIKGGRFRPPFLFLLQHQYSGIGGVGVAGFSSGFSVIETLVVRSIEAMEDAF